MNIIRLTVEIGYEGQLDSQDLVDNIACILEAADLSSKDYTTCNGRVVIETGSGEGDFESEFNPNNTETIGVTGFPGYVIVNDSHGVHYDYDNSANFMRYYGAYLLPGEEPHVYNQLEDTFYTLQEQVRDNQHILGQTLKVYALCEVDPAKYNHLKPLGDDE